MKRTNRRYEDLRELQPHLQGMHVVQADGERVTTEMEIDGIDDLKNLFAEVTGMLDAEPFLELESRFADANFPPPQALLPELPKIAEEAIAAFNDTLGTRLNLNHPDEVLQVCDELLLRGRDAALRAGDDRVVMRVVRALTIVVGEAVRRLGGEDSWYWGPGIYADGDGVPVVDDTGEVQRGGDTLGAGPFPVIQSVSGFLLTPSGVVLDRYRGEGNGASITRRVDRLVDHAQDEQLRQEAVEAPQPTDLPRIVDFVFVTSYALIFSFFAWVGASVLL